MITTSPQDLKYGIIYLYSDRRLSPGMHDPEAIVSKFVYPMQVEWIDEPGRVDLLLIARRFNVGNIGQYATVSLTLSRMNRSGGWFEAIRHFADALMGVGDAGAGDIVLNENDYGYQYFDQSSVFGAAREAAPQDHTRVKKSSEMRARKSLGKKLRERIDEAEGALIDFIQSREACPKSEPDLLDNYESGDARALERALLDKEEAEAVRALERERKEALERIKRDIINYIAHYHDDPKDLIAELLRGKVVVGKPGRVLVNGDLHIVLPEYDEMEIPMPAMCRTLYILFMKQRKQGNGGIVLKNIDDYYDEIIDIYSMVKPGANEERVRLTADNLCDPLSGSLNQTISRINRCVRNVITDKELAKKYTITGSKGGTYSLALDPEYLELPRAITA